jgi:hypothetical protein
MEQYTKLAIKMKNGNNMCVPKLQLKYQMATKYTNVFNTRTFKNIPIGILV